ncbi:MAG: hypothetical protein AB7E47_05755 [Desulfovibrionaceae bacterium]
MAVFKMNLTTLGKEVLARANAGETFAITAIVLGAGVWSEAQQGSYDLAALVDQKISLAITGQERSGEAYKVSAVLSNASLAAGFVAREMGVLVHNDSMGTVLYMAGYVGDEYTYVTDAATAPVSYPINLTIVVGSSGNITVQVADNVFATQADLVTHDEDADVHAPLVDALAVATPVMTAPLAGATDVIEQAVLKSSAFFTRLADVAHGATQYQVDLATGDFSDPALDTGALGAVTQYTLPLGELDESTAYKARCRYRTGAGQWSAWSAAVSWTTRADFVYVTPPSIITPTDGATGVGETPTIQTSPFAVHGGTDSHIGSRYQIQVAGGDWSTLAYDSGEVVTLLTRVLGAGILQVGTAYNIRARHRGTTYGWSEWSDEITITTAAAFIVGDEAATWEASAEDWPYAGLLSNAAYNASAPVEQDADEGAYAAATPRVVDPSPLALALDAATTAAVLRWTGRTLAEDDAVLVGLADGSLHARALGAVSAYSQINAVTNDVDGGENNNTYGSVWKLMTFLPTVGQSITHLGTYSTTPAVVALFVLSAADLILEKIVLDHPGGGWAFAALDTPRTVVSGVHLGIGVVSGTLTGGRVVGGTWYCSTLDEEDAAVGDTPTGWTGAGNEAVMGYRTSDNDGDVVDAVWQADLDTAVASTPSAAYVGGHQLLFASGGSGQVLRPATVALPRDLAIESLAASGLTFTCDTADTSGHFSAAVANPIKAGCQIQLSGVSGILTLGAITGDGTAADAVPVSGAALAAATYDVEWIRGLEVTAAGLLRLLAASSAWQAAIDQGFADVTAINGITVTDAVGTGAIYYALTPDGGASWQMWTGSAWRTIASSLAADHGGADGDWYSRDGADAWTAATDAYAALRAACAASATNRMASAVLNGCAAWPAITGAVACATILWTDDTATLPTVTQIALDLTGPSEFVDFEAVAIVTRTWGLDGSDPYITLIGEEVELAADTRRVALGLARAEAGGLPSGQIDLTRLGS